MLWNYNQEKNETDGFESPRHLVLRRGFSFDFIIQVSNHEHLIEELVKVEFRRGYRARFSRGTLFQAVCGTKSRQHYQWKMEVRGENTAVSMIVICYIIIRWSAPIKGRLGIECTLHVMYQLVVTSVTFVYQSARTSPRERACGRIANKLCFCLILGIKVMLTNCCYAHVYSHYCGFMTH